MSTTSIYIVDEYLLSRLTYRRYFENIKNFDIIGDFSSAESCIEQMEYKQADVILMDIELMGMDGIKATKIIAHKFPKTKIIIVSSYKNKEKILSCLINGACGYVVKSENYNLRRTIESVMNGNFLLDLKIAKLIFSSISNYGIENKNSIYENNKLKNTLTARELEVLKLLTAGKTNSEIAKEIIVSINTAKAHVGNILTKLEVTDRVQAAVKAVKAKLF